MAATTPFFVLKARMATSYEDPCIARNVIVRGVTNLSRRLARTYWSPPKEALLSVQAYMPF